MSNASADAANVPPKNGIDAAAPVTLLSNFENADKLFDSAFDTSAIMPATFNAPAPSLTNPAPTALAPAPILAKRPVCLVVVFPSASATADGTCLRSILPPPPPLPLSAFKISLKVASEAALIAVTSPIPGISIFTSAIFVIIQLTAHINTLTKYLKHIMYLPEIKPWQNKTLHQM